MALLLLELLCTMNNYKYINFTILDVYLNYKSAYYHLHVEISLIVSTSMIWSSFWVCNAIGHRKASSPTERQPGSQVRLQQCYVDERSTSVFSGQASVRPARTHKRAMSFITFVREPSASLPAPAPPPSAAELYCIRDRDVKTPKFFGPARSSFFRPGP